MKFIKELSLTSFFRDLTEDELNTALEKAVYHVKEYPADSHVADEGEELRSLGIILSGSVIACRELPSGKTVIISKLEKGQTFGEAALFSHKAAYPASIRTETAASIFFLSKDSVASFFSLNRKFLMSYIRLLSDRIALLGAAISDLSYPSIRGKLANFLLTEHKKHNSLSFEISYTRIRLAEKFNIPRPSLSRELCSLRDEGIIEFNRGHFRIIDPEALSDILA